jgi:hypothetical protein
MQAIGSSVPSSNALMLREAVCTLFGFGRGALLLRAMHRRLVRIGLGFSLLFAASANAQIPPLRSAYPPSQTPPPGSPLIGRDLRKVRIGALIWAAGYLPALVAPLVLWPRVESGEGPSALANYSLLVPVVGITAGVIAFDDPVTTQVLLGAALTIVGVGVITMRRPQLVEGEG